MAPPESDEIVGQGPDDGPATAGRSWLRRAALVAAALVVVAGLSRSGLLSSDSAPAPEPTPTGSTSSAPPVTGPRLVARVDDRLVLAAAGPARAGVRLPPGLPADARLVAIPPGGTDADPAADAPGPVVGAFHRQLFRADPNRPRWRSLGAADLVVAAGLRPARALVERGGTLQEVEVSTGATTDPDPYPGFEPQTWTPEGVLGGAGVGAVLMSRPGQGGETVLALAFPHALVESGQREPVRELGSYGELLGIADDWAIMLGPDCPGATCTLVVVSVTRDSTLAREVAPPSGWTFVRGPIAGRTHEALVPVRLLDAASVEPGSVALARLVPGGDSALLVRGTGRVRLASGLADGPGGSVYLLSAPVGSSDLEPRVWDPDAPNSSSPLRPSATFPETARLVCVCG